MIEDEDDGRIFQLSWTLIYDPAPFMSIEPFNSWSSQTDTLEKWIELVRSTTGYKKAIEIGLKVARLRFQEV